MNLKEYPKTTRIKSQTKINGSCEVLNTIYWNASNLKLNEAKEKNKSKQNKQHFFQVSDKQENNNYLKQFATAALKSVKWIWKC